MGNARDLWVLASTLRRNGTRLDWSIQTSSGLVTVRTDTPIVVGRGADIAAELRCDHPLVSRQHLSLIATGGVLTARDLDSRNGTTLRRQGAVAPLGPETVLAAGDQLYIGDDVLLATIHQRLAA